MKSNIKISAIIVLFFITINCKAQIPVDMKSALQNKTWVVGPDTTVTLKFTNTNMIISVNNIVKGSIEYHFTDKKCSEAVLDKSKVGVVTNGQYIITEQDCCLIQFINENSFKMGTVTNNQLEEWLTYQAVLE